MALEANNRFVLRIDSGYDCSIITSSYRLSEGVPLIKTIEWTEEGVRMIDQRKLPTVEEYPTFRTYEEVAEAIRVMVVRGAPAIGVAAAMGVALGVRNSKSQTLDELQQDFELITATLAGTRPTAVNLFWAIERMKLTFSKALKAGTARQDIGQILIDEAQAIYDEDLLPSIAGQLFQIKNQEYEIKTKALETILNQRMLEAAAKSKG